MTPDRDPTEFTACEALAAFAGGRLSAVAYARSLLDRCRQFDWLNALIGAPSATLLAEAEAADRRRAEGRPAGPLDGLPLVIKDNIDVAGWVTTGGAPGLAQHRPRRSAPVAASLAEAGALLLGKTNMHELAYGITSNNGAFGPVRNPYDVRLIAGGSSGGTGAAVAARMAPAGLGSDTGGSVRIPAALCGIAGLRPTIGRYPQTGIVPISHSRDTAGPMARSIADLALLDGVIANDHTPLATLPLKGLKLGSPRPSHYETVEPAVAAVMDETFARLRRSGVELIEADLPELRGLLRDTGRKIAFYETLTDFPHYLAESGATVTFEQVVADLGSPDVAAIFADMLTHRVAEADYHTARDDTMTRVKTLYRDYFARHGAAAVVFPATVLPARPIGQDDVVSLCGRQISTFSAYLRNTEPATIAGIPGVVLPAGLTPDGLPVGLELDGPAGSDRRLLAIAAAIEAILPRLPAPRPDPGLLR
jgi:indoleacetamide hydrolase